jgi:hypothetical protein
MDLYCTKLCVVGSTGVFLNRKQFFIQLYRHICNLLLKISHLLQFMTHHNEIKKHIYMYKFNYLCDLSFIVHYGNYPTNLHIYLERIDK